MTATPAHPSLHARSEEGLGVVPKTTLSVGQTRVNEDRRTQRNGSVRSSTPRAECGPGAEARLPTFFWKDNACSNTQPEGSSIRLPYRIDNASGGPRNSRGI
jgi:hypothetical protein